MRLGTLRLGALGAACALLGAALWRSRPARVEEAAVTSVEGGRPPLAHVALAYGGGAPPVCVVVDVLGAGGEPLGSATAFGGRRLLEVPLAAEADAYRVAVTTARRMPWGVWLRRER